jgi:hypothetical protein
MDYGAKVSDKESTDFSELDINQFRLLNNKWGSDDIETNVKQTIYIDTVNNIIGWQWNRPNPQLSSCGTYPCPNYPEVIVGTNKGQWNPSTSPYFPVRYGDIDNWTVDLGWTYPIKPTGDNNLAFDIYWMNPDYTTRYYNVMIWIQGNYSQTNKIVTDGINEYYYFHESKQDGDGSRPWDCFQLKNQNKDMTNLSIDIKALLDTISNRRWDVEDRDNWMIPDIQLGNEVALNFGSSSGRIEINKYNINLNGNLIQLKSA